MNNLNTIIQTTKNLTLLYVEDNEEARESTSALLSEFFGTIIIAKDGLEGLQKYEWSGNLNSY